MNERGRTLHLAVPKISLGLSSPLVLDLQARKGTPAHQTLSESSVNPVLPDAEYVAALPELSLRYSSLRQQQSSWKSHFESRCKAFLTKSECSALQGLLKNSKLPFLRPFPGLIYSTDSRAQDGGISNLRERTGTLRGSRKQQAYVHFSSPIRPAVKTSPSKSKPNGNNLPAGAVAQRNMQPAALKPFPGATAQSLLECGLTCLPLAWRDRPLLPQIRKSRAEIHVYVPREEDNTGSELLGEDIDSKLSSLSLRDEK